ncbi:hypothetical protein VNO77_36577 [Canavalia gladiata]|uniref:Uncharacterized protein n=1 Tax=Canavalia gladiata TaxID=3824 RepID=A0AAN9PWB2_CANGL
MIRGRGDGNGKRHKARKGICLGSDPTELRCELCYHMHGRNKRQDKILNKWGHWVDLDCEGVYSLAVLSVLVNFSMKIEVGGGISQHKKQKMLYQLVYASIALVLFLMDMIIAQKQIGFSKAA